MLLPFSANPGVSRIGDVVIGGTPDSVLFIGADGNLAESNPGFTYDATSGSEQVLITGNGGSTADLVVRATTGNWLDVGTAAGLGLFVGKVLIGATTPVFMTLTGGAVNNGPEFSLSNETDDLLFAWENNSTSWEITSFVDTI